MQYEWYIDVFFFVNFIMDVLLLKVLSGILKIPVSAKRLMAGGAIGAAGSCLAGILWWTPAGWRMVCGGFLPACAMLRIAFRPESLRAFVKMFLLLLMETFCIGGMFEAVYQHTEAGYYLAWILQGNLKAGMPVIMWGFLALGSWFGFRFLWFVAMEVKRERQTMYQVILRAGDRRAEAVGYLDTGNNLRIPGKSLLAGGVMMDAPGKPDLAGGLTAAAQEEEGCQQGSPVHIVSDKLWKNLWRPGMHTIQIPFRTIGNPLGVMEGTQIDSMEIRKETGEKKLVQGPWIARAPFRLTRDGGYDVLLHKEAL